MIDSGIGGSHFGIEGIKFLVLERVEDLIEASDAIWSLPFHFSVFFAHETSKKISRFYSRPPFRVFTLESFFPFSFLFFLLSYYALKIHPEQVNGLSRILAED